MYGEISRAREKLCSRPQLVVNRCEYYRRTAVNPSMTHDTRFVREKANVPSSDSYKASVKPGLTRTTGFRQRQGL